MVPSLSQQYSWKAIRNHEGDGGLGKFIAGSIHKAANLDNTLFIAAVKKGWTKSTELVYALTVLSAAIY